MDLAELKAGVADVEVTYKKHTFTVGYRPEAVSEDDLQALESFQEQSGVALLRATVPPLVRLLVRWSITNGDDPLPVNEETITSLPPRMRVNVLEAIMRDFFSPGNESSSDAGSPPAAVSEDTAPSTLSSSGMQNGPVSLPGISPASLTLVAP